MKRIILFGLSLTMASLLSGCPCEPRPGRSAIQQTNNSPDTITGFYVRPSGTTNWGGNHALTGVFPGGVICVNSLTPGCYEFRTQDSGGSSDVTSVCIGPGEVRRFSWEPIKAEPGNLAVERACEACR